MRRLRINEEFMRAGAGARALQAAVILLTGIGSWWRLALLIAHCAS